MNSPVAERVRRVLTEQGFTVEGLAQHVGEQAVAGLARGQHVPLHRAMADQACRTTLDHFIELFLVGVPIPASALPLQLVADLEDLGLVGRDRDRVAPLVEVLPYGEPDTAWYVVSDLGPPRHAEHVLGVGGASLTLARITPRPVVGRTLDLGCGAGVQVLHAARHCRQVVATDTNPRALELTSLSARLSGIAEERLDLRKGSLFDPVSDEQFDLVVSNPPFVISPSRRFSYRDAGLPGDELSRLVVRGAAQHLAPGGTAAVLANWLHLSDQNWRERVSEWVAGTGVDAWVVQRDTQSTAAYAETWLRDAQVPDGSEFDAAMHACLDAFESSGAEAVGFGWFLLRAPSDPSSPEPSTGWGALQHRWVVAEDLSGSERLPAGDEVRSFLDGCAHVESLSVPELLGSHARLADGVTITTTKHHLGGSIAEVPPSLGILGSVGSPGWRPAVMVPPALVTALLGPAETPVGQRLDEAARVEGLDPLDILGPALTGLRELVRVGIVRTT